MPNPAADGPSVTIIDAGPVWTALQGHGWVPKLVGSASRVVLVSRLAVPGLRRLEASLGLLGEHRVVAAVVGPPARRWPRSVACTLGPLTRALIGSERFTPTSGSWLNLVEVWFGIIERQAIRRGTFTSARDLMAKIRAFITGWNRRKHPFMWTKTPDEILTKINRKRKHVSTTSH